MNMNMIKRDICKFPIFSAVMIAAIVITFFFTSTAADESIATAVFQSDSVTISGKSFLVPQPWRGRKIGDKSDPQPDNLAMLPLEYGYDSSRIYVTQETKTAFMAMAEASANDGVFFQVRSGFRSYSYQAQIFARRMGENKSFDDVARFVAPPGYSEHMLGTALDLVTDTAPFAESKAYKWLKINAGKFGFTESYPKDSKESFIWEPWHWRFDAGQKSDKTEE